MAQYEICIPSAAFGAGGPLENADEIKARVVLPVRLKDRNNALIGSENTCNKLVVEDFDLQPFSTIEYATILNMIDKGILEIKLVGGAALTPANFVTLYRSIYQQL